MGLSERIEPKIQSPNESCGPFAKSVSRGHFRREFMRLRTRIGNLSRLEPLHSSIKFAHASFPIAERQFVRANEL
jgi:hypothetical protein